MARNLSRLEIIEEVKRIAEPIVEELEFELVDVEYDKENVDYFLRVYIYKEDGVGVEDCQTISRLLSDAIDEADPIPGAYILEVSSPGLDRPIETDRDMERNLNKEVEVKLYSPIDKRRQFEGKLLAYDDETITILENDEEITIKRDSISLMRLVIRF